MAKSKANKKEEKGFLNKRNHCKQEYHKRKSRYL